MKNLMIAAALSLGTMTAFAQEETIIEETGTAVEETATDANDAATDAVQETYSAAEEGTSEAVDTMEDAADEATDTMQDGFKEVAMDEVPEAITTACKEAHPGATVNKVSMNDQSQYKLEVTKEDGETSEMYMDAEGNMIDM